MARRTLRSLLLALLLAGGLPSPAGGTCRLPVTFPRTARPSGATAGPGNTLIFASGSGTLLFLDLDDYSMREDTALNDKYQDMYGSFDLQGLAMSDTLSNYVYFVAQGKASVFQYDFKDTRRIVRRFDLPGFSGSSAAGAESLTWVPTQASPHGGYFYVGSQLAGQVFVYELPINDDSAPVVSGDSKQLMTIWTPLKESQTVAGLSYSGGYLFVNYDERYSNHVLIYPILPNGLPGELKEQYQVDVSNAEGLVARQSDGKSWEVMFTSNRDRGVFAYRFQFVSGFELHHHCSFLSDDAMGASASPRFASAAQLPPSGAASLRPLALAPATVLAAALLLQPALRRGCAA